MRDGIYSISASNGSIPTLRFMTVASSTFLSRREERRALRREAHATFDRVWQLGIMSRSHAYRWLADAMGIPKCRCHIGMMREEDLRRVVVLVRTRLRSPRAEILGVER